MRMGQGEWTGLEHGASPVSYRHNFLFFFFFPYSKSQFYGISSFLNVHRVLRFQHNFCISVANIKHTVMNIKSRSLFKYSLITIFWFF